MPYLTHDSAAADTVCRTFRIPTNFLREFMGALYELSLPYRWEEFGALTIDEQAELFREIVDTYHEGCMIGIPFAYITENPPDGSLPLDGSSYDGADYPLLYASIDPQWDNLDGTFTLPDLRGRAIIGAGHGTGLTDRPTGAMIGAESVVLTVGQLAPHDHTESQAIPDVVVVAPGEVPSVSVSTPGATGSTGAGEAHPNMQPSIALPMAVWYR